MVKVNTFKEEYKKLNKAQKEAVDITDGPVMVVAGPGTGKTQILSLRIGNILLKTDTKASEVLCLTFTNSAVKAMRERLRRYIGSEASKVKVATFHSFGLEVIEDNYQALGLDSTPKLLEEQDTLALFDSILNEYDWEYIRPRSNSSRYFRDLKNLISFLKKEGISPRQFTEMIENEIEQIETSENSISTRGRSKGEMKKDALRKIEALARTRESAKFYELYQKTKKEKNLFDFDDILESLSQLVGESSEVTEDLRLNYQYVLIDEHQDSSGVQNDFLERVWQEVEKPNIFVVGDDRQLIYGFGGASLEYFENFKNTFGKAKLITLTENYRSTQKILDSAHRLLESSLTKGKLKSNTRPGEDIKLVEAYYPRDEIISIALDIKNKIKQGQDANTMAVLVPKNRQVKSTIAVLEDMGIDVSGEESIDFFEVPEARSFIRVLKIIANPATPIFAESFFDPLSGVPPITAHNFLKDNLGRSFSLLNTKGEIISLFSAESEVNVWIDKLRKWISDSNLPLYTLVQKVGTEFLLDTVTDHSEMLRRIEVVRTMVHLVLREIERDKDATLNKFLELLERIESYGESLPLAIFAPDEGVKVMTLHGSKGLEFDYVWIAHMDERSFAGSRRGGFALPELISKKAEARDNLALKRQLYVAITRARHCCIISYARKSYTGGDQELTHILSEMEDNFSRQSAQETEQIILKQNKQAYVTQKDKKEKHVDLKELTKLVASDYEDRKISVSLLNNFFECPWKWYFRSLLKLPEPKTDSLEMGNKVHNAIDSILKLAKEPSQKKIAELTHHDKKASEIVSVWVKGRLKEISKKRESEKSVSVKDDRFPELTMYGKLDLIEYLDKDSVRVTDFKTGKVRKKSEIEKLDEEERLSKYMRQLAMYSYLLEKSPKWKVGVRESRLEFVEADKSSEMFYDKVVTEEEMNLLKKDLKDYNHLIKTGGWTTRPCHYNPYGSKNTTCMYCQMAEIYQ